MDRKMNELHLTKMTFWFNNNKNVLLVGRSGVGKTGMIRDFSEIVGLKLGDSIAYYSSHDADFIGDPTKAKMILFDNLNDPKALAAAHEISSLKVWKGQPVKGCLWGCYTAPAEKILSPFEKKKDPQAEKEKEKRESEEQVHEDWVSNIFEVTAFVPYSLNKEWFLEKFTEKMATIAFEWWGQLEDFDKSIVSPRKLAAALELYIQRGDMRDVLPVSANISKLTNCLNMGPIVEKLEQLVKANNEEEVRAFLADENKWNLALKGIRDSTLLMTYFLPLLLPNQIESIMDNDDKILQFVIANCEQPAFKNICKGILQRNNSPRLSKVMRRHLLENQHVSRTFAEPEDGQ